MSAVAAMSSRSGPGVRSVVEAMLAASPHRGTRTRLASLGRVVVGISDHPELPDAGLSADGEFAIAFAGTVDNVAELARDAGIREGMDRDRSSAGVLLATFRREGEALPGVLRGAYAIVVTDGVTLWTFRDHLGMGTLFYRDDPDRFYAASEAKQVVAGSGVPLEPDLDVLEAIFYSDYDDGTPSALRGVSRLPKAVLLRADPDRTRTRRYWVPERLIETARLRGDELPGRFHALMEQAVVRSFGGADVIALSGGIDSPALAAYAAGAYVERTGEPLSALSAVYPHMPSCDESEYIDVVAKDLGLRSHTFVRDRPTLDGLQEWVRLFDGPAPQWTVSQGEEFHREARRLGFRTIMTGEVAEFVIDARHHLVDHYLHHARISPLVSYLMRKRSGGTTWKALGREVAGAIAPRWALNAYLRARHPKDVYRPDWLDPQPVLERPHYRSYFLAPRRRWLEGQLTGFNGPGLSVEADSVAQQVAGVRTRRPWADVDLWEFFLSLRAEVKFPTTESKGLVRELLRGRVPDAILDRNDKTHFNEYVMSSIDYPGLRKWLVDPPHRIPGVRYERLAEHLEAEDLRLYDYIWARDLAAVHAFLGLW